MGYFASQDPRSYSFSFDLNICFRAWPQPEMNFMMTSPKFSTWRSNQGARSRVTFQLFATPRSHLFPQYFRSFAFEWWGSKRVGKKWQLMKFWVFSKGKTTENGSVSAQRSTWRGAKHMKIEGVFQFFDLWKKYFWNLHKICLLMVVLLS